MLNTIHPPIPQRTRYAKIHLSMFKGKWSMDWTTANGAGRYVRVTVDERLKQIDKTDWWCRYQNLK